MGSWQIGKISYTHPETASDAQLNSSMAIFTRHSPVRFRAAIFWAPAGRPEGAGFHTKAKFRRLNLMWRTLAMANTGQPKNDAILYYRRRLSPINGKYTIWGSVQNGGRS